jgi:hypothetical protein
LEAQSGEGIEVGAAEVGEGQLARVGEAAGVAPQGHGARSDEGSERVDPWCARTGDRGGEVARLSVQVAGPRQVADMGERVGLPGERIGASVTRVLAGIGGDHGDPTAGQRNTKTMLSRATVHSSPRTWASRSDTPRASPPARMLVNQPTYSPRWRNGASPRGRSVRGGGWLGASPRRLIR